MSGEIAPAIEMNADIGQTIHPHPALSERIGMVLQFDLPCRTDTADFLASSCRVAAMAAGSVSLLRSPAAAFASSPRWSSWSMKVARLCSRLPMRVIFLNY
jgi:hypothetical protein